MKEDKGNKKFWDLKPKRGRPTAIPDPETLWEMCLEYFEMTHDRYYEKKEWKGNPPNEVTTKLKVPFTQFGLMLFLGIDENTWCRYRKYPEYERFHEVVARVDRIIYTQKFEGATLDLFNHNVITRDLQLSDTINNVNMNLDANVDFSKLTEEEKNLLFQISLKLKPSDK